MRMLFRLVLILALLVPNLALAQDWGRLMTPIRPLNVRLDRSPKAGKVKTIRPGDVVRVDFLKDGWYAIFDPKETQRDVGKALGYSKASYLEPVGQAGGWGEIMAVNAPMLNVRTGRGPGFQHVRTLYEGDLIKVDFLKDGWVAVFETDATKHEESQALGYTNAGYLKKPSASQLASLSQGGQAPAQAAGQPEEDLSQDEPDTTEAAEPAPLPEPGSDWGEIIRLATQVLVLKEPDVHAKVVATLLVGDVIKVLHIKDQWYQAYLPQEMDPEPMHSLGWVREADLGGSGREVTAESVAAAATESHPAYEPQVPLQAPQETEEEKANPILEQMAKDDAKAQTMGQDEDGVNIVREPVDKTPLPPVTMPDDEQHDGQGLAQGEAQEDAGAPAFENQESENQESGDQAAGQEQEYAQPPTATSTFTASADQPAQEYEITVPEYVEGESQQGREPVATEDAHGYRYAVLGKSGTEPFAKTMSVGIYLDVEVVPGADDLRDFAATIWRKEGQADKNVVVDIYLPGQNLRSLSYVTATFDAHGPVEFWTRETTLYGTRFK